MRVIAYCTAAVLLGCGWSGSDRVFASEVVPQEQPQQTPPQQQEPQQQPQQPQAPADPGRKFSAPAGILFNIIKADRTADFEKFLDRLHEALQKSVEPQRKQQAAGWRVYKVSEPDAKGNVMYLYFVDPAVSSADYTATRIIAEVMPSEAQAIYETIKDAFAGQSIANLTLVKDFSKPLQ
jgi:hypothetical protein